MAKLIGLVIVGVGSFFTMALTILLIGLLISYPVMWLWNACLVGFIPGIVGIEHWWHAWGILVLCGILFRK